MKRRQVCCCLGVEKERSKVMKVCVCVCVCVLVGMVGELKNGTKCTYTFVSENGVGAVSSVRSSGGMCSGRSE